MQSGRWISRNVGRTCSCRKPEARRSTVRWDTSTTASRRCCAPVAGGCRRSCRPARGCAPRRNPWCRWAWRVRWPTRRRGPRRCSPCTTAPGFPSADRPGNGRRTIWCSTTGSHTAPVRGSATTPSMSIARIPPISHVACARCSRPRTGRDVGCSTPPGSRGWSMPRCRCRACPRRRANRASPWARTCRWRCVAPWMPVLSSGMRCSRASRT